jgi:Phasin protein
MFEQMSNQVLSFSKQFADSVIKANTVAVDHFEKIVEVQLKGFEDRLNTVADFVETAAVVKNPEDFRALMPKGVNLIKHTAEKNVALSQEIVGITTRATEAFASLVKGQFDVANDNVLKAAKVVAKK